MNTKNNENYIRHLKNFGYMKGVDRSDRIKYTEEVFTPFQACDYYLEHLKELKSDIFSNTELPIIDNTVGDGEWLGAILIKRLESGATLNESLKTLFGCDLEISNIKKCHDRLSCNEPSVLPILQKNIVVSNALQTEYRFDGTDPKKSTADIHFDSLFDLE